LIKPLHVPQKLLAVEACSQAWRPNETPQPATGRYARGGVLETLTGLLPSSGSGTGKVTSVLSFARLTAARREISPKTSIWRPVSIFFAFRFRRSPSALTAKICLSHD
jgi:hypothetical protein